MSRALPFWTADEILNSLIFFFSLIFIAVTRWAAVTGFGSGLRFRVIALRPRPRQQISCLPSFLYFIFRQLQLLLWNFIWRSRSRNAFFHLAYRPFISFRGLSALTAFVFEFRIFWSLLFNWKALQVARLTLWLFDAGWSGFVKLLILFLFILRVRYAPLNQLFLLFFLTFLRLFPELSQRVASHRLFFLLIRLQSAFHLRVLTQFLH